MNDLEDVSVLPSANAFLPERLSMQILWKGVQTAVASQLFWLRRIDTFLYSICYDAMNAGIKHTNKMTKNPVPLGGINPETIITVSTTCRVWCCCCSGRGQARREKG